MENTNKSRKRKKSGAENRKASQARKEENERLGSFMKSHFTTSSKSSHEDNASSNAQEPINAAGDIEDEEGKHLKDGASPDKPCDVDDENDIEDEVEVVQDPVNLPVFDNESEVSDGNVQDDEMEVQESGLSEEESEDTIIIEQCMLPRNPALVNDGENETTDPALLVGVKFSIEDKEKLCKSKPCQPPESVLSERKKKIGERNRYCSQTVFFHEDQSMRKWLSYSLSKDCLFCLPCLLFSDECLRGENLRHNQGNAFTNAGYSNWKKQYSDITKHERSESHINAKIAQVLFMQGRSIESCLEQQEKSEILRRKREVVENRSIMKRVVDTVVYLGKQGLAFRGHRESLTDGPEANKGNFLESLNYLSIYDVTIDNHLEKVRNQQALLRRRKGGKKGAKGRGSKLTFLSNDTQNNVINIIGKEIASQIVKEIGNCKAWALIVDTTPDVSHHEQLSICARIVNRIGKCSEHLLSCKRASGTKAMELYNLISETLVSKGVSFDNLVAQTYDGAANMSGCYNGLQAIIKEKVGKHVAFVHCYAHTLNLVLSDSASVSVPVISLFSDLEALYVLFSKTQKIHDLFEAVQREDNLKVLSLKRLNTVRWHSREFCLKVLLSRYDCILSVLETVAFDAAFEGNPRKTGAGLLTTIQTKQFLATAYLFREIFASTGPLSRYLQRVDVDFGKALGMVESAIDELNELRKEPERILRCVEQMHDSPSVTWQQPRIRRRRRMDGENAEDEPAETPEDDWKRNTFYLSVDTVLNSMKNRFEKNQPLLKAFSLFSPSRFPELVKKFKTAHDLQACLNTFCETYNIDAFRCADELFNFARSFEKLDCSTVYQPDEAQDDEDDGMDSEDDDYNDDYENDDDDEVSSTPDIEQSDSGTKEAEKQTKKKVPSFSEALSLLCNPDYSLVDAYPTLCRVYAIAVAIPVSSSTAERSFSALKRVKTRIRSSMVQERLESLLSMTIERKILLKCDKDRLINLYAKLSPELSKALL